MGGFSASPNITIQRELSLQCPFDTATRQAPISEQCVLRKTGQCKMMTIGPSSGAKHTKISALALNKWVTLGEIHLSWP